MCREYIIRCEHITDNIWTPIAFFATDGENEQIVRCKDCSEWRTWTEQDYRNPYDDTEYECCECSLFKTSNPDGFCAWGERKDK